MAADFVGTGWAYPIRTDATGGIALVSHSQEIEEAITIVLGTAYGERPMRPEFGCGIHDYVFAPVNATTAGRLAFEVRASLARWEPRIDVRDVLVTTRPGEDSTLFIEITYVIEGTNDPRNLVFPFYTIPNEEPL